MLTDVCLNSARGEDLGSAPPAKKRQRLMYYPSLLEHGSEGYANTSTTVDHDTNSREMEWGFSEGVAGDTPTMEVVHTSNNNNNNSDHPIINVYLATIFPLRHFVAQVDELSKTLILKCKYCQKFEHLAGHSHPMELPVRNALEIQRLYNPELNLELNGHLAFCLNCSDHEVRSWGQAFYQLLKHPSSVREDHANYWVLSRFLYLQALQNSNPSSWVGGPGDWLSKEQMERVDAYMKDVKSRRQIVSFPCIAESASVYRG